MAYPVFTDSTGATHVTADRRYLLYDLCDRLLIDRRSIRWSTDLRCHVLIVRKQVHKKALRRFLKIDGKGGVMLVSAANE